MIKEIKICTCDICRKETQNFKTINYPVLFLTDQTDGSGVKPYISQQKLDVCQDCLYKIIMLKGRGAMGNNTYIIERY